MSPDLVAMYSQIATPFLLFMALFLGYTVLMRFLRVREETRDNQTVVNVGNPDPELPRGGFAFIDVEDEHKVLFVEAMSGFSDFAKLKGYNVELSIDTTLPGKVGIRFVITDAGITVSTATVRKDVDEYIERLRSTDDLSDMPMPENSIEHARLLAALQTRFSYLRSQVEMLAVKEGFYRRIMSEWTETSVRAISYSPVQVNLLNEGQRNMRDSYNATNSQNVAQGREAKAVMEGSTAQIGASHLERANQIKSLAELESAISNSELSAEAKQTALRHIQNTREELEQSKDPKPDEVSKWLGRASAALKTASAGAGLMEKFQQVLDKFGLSGS